MSSSSFLSPETSRWEPGVGMTDRCTLTWPTSSASSRMANALRGDGVIPLCGGGETELHVFFRRLQKLHCTFKLFEWANLEKSHIKCGCTTSSMCRCNSILLSWCHSLEVLWHIPYSTRYKCWDDSLKIHFTTSVGILLSWYTLQMLEYFSHDTLYKCWNTSLMIHFTNVGILLSWYTLQVLEYFSHDTLYKCCDILLQYTLQVLEYFSHDKLYKCCDILLQYTLQVLEYFSRDSDSYLMTHFISVGTLPSKYSSQVSSYVFHNTQYT